MSAINGIFERQGNSISEAAFSLSLQALDEYGIDGRNHWTSSSIALGHQKKSLLPKDETTEIPFYNAQSKLTITSDARIDNTLELCEKLAIPQNEQSNLSDCQIILKAYQKWGRDCPLHLIGDYAFAIWDEREKTLFCARDHIGVIPFYYHISAERFVFASDIKGIVAHPEVSDELNENFVINSLAYGNFYIPDQTHFSSIRRLPPGHTLTVKKDSEKLEKYWFPENVEKTRYANDEDYVEAARELLIQAVNNRLRTKKKVGVHVSGGLDSSSVAVLTNRYRQQMNLPAPKAFIWQPTPDYSKPLEREHRQIEAVCKQEGFTPIYCPVKAEDTFEVFKKDPTTTPIYSAPHAEYTIQKEAQRRSVRLMLSGWGGDEALSFSRRGYYAELLLNGKFLKLLKESRRRNSALGFLAYEFLLLFFSDRGEGGGKLQNRSLFYKKPLSSYLHPELKDKIDWDKPKSRQLSIRSTMLWLWNLGFLTSRIECWAALGAEHKIKYAYPLLDRRIMEFVISLPSNQFVRDDGVARWIMRRTLDNIVPSEVCWQPTKLETVRVESTKLAFHKAQGMVSKEIALNNFSADRARFLDMNRFLNDIKSVNNKNDDKETKGIGAAIQFLDF